MGFRNISQKGEILSGKRIVRRVLTALFLVVFAFSSVMLALRITENLENQHEADEALLIAGLSERTPTPTGTTPAKEAESTVETETTEDTDANSLPADMAYLADIDLSTLRAVNKDVVGWIMIPDTVVSYPLMRGEDNQFYLKHSWQGSSNSGGSIFLDYRCSPDLSDSYSVIYGHRMRNDSMFGTLKYYVKADYWQEHPSVWIVTNDAIRRYDIFAVWEAPVDSAVYTMDFSSEQAFRDFLDMALSESVISTGITPTTEDPILTLSTCTSFGHSSRLIIQAVLALEAER